MPAQRSRRPVEVDTVWDAVGKRHIPLMYNRESQFFYAYLGRNNTGQRVRADTHADLKRQVERALAPEPEITWTRYLRFTVDYQGAIGADTVELALFTAGWRQRRAGDGGGGMLIFPADWTFPRFVEAGKPTLDRQGLTHDTAYLLASDVVADSLTAVVVRLHTLTGVFRRGVAGLADHGRGNESFGVLANLSWELKLLLQRLGLEEE